MKKALISLLVALLVAPLNASAASWMAMSMSNSDHHLQHEHSFHGDTHHNGHGVDPFLETHDFLDIPETHNALLTFESHGDPQSAQHHEHNAADCEEHCASCTNHCSSLGIVTTTQGRIDTEADVTGMLSGTPSNYFELLFRPPITT